MPRPRQTGLKGAEDQAGRPMTLVITVGLPGRALSPNGRAHHMERAAAGAVVKREAWARTVEALARGRFPAGVFPARRAVVEYRFFWPDSRRRDADNARTLAKSALDGVVLGGALADDCLAMGDGAGVTADPVRFAVDRKRPRLEVHVTPEREDGGAE